MELQLQRHAERMSINGIIAYCIFGTKFTVYFRIWYDLYIVTTYVLLYIWYHVYCLESNMMYIYNQLHNILYFWYQVYCFILNNSVAELWIITQQYAYLRMRLHTVFLVSSLLFYSEQLSCWVMNNHSTVCISENETAYCRVISLLGKYNTVRTLVDEK